jgi:hypothetical protein
VAASLFLPWWSLNSNIVNGQDALFSFTISPLGVGINTIVGDPRALLAPLEVVYIIVTILFIPISSSLGLAAFNGIYCAIRKRSGVRILVAPLWGTIAILWWLIYFLFVYSFFNALGLNIQPTGSASITWGSYQLAGATWGWDTGLWLGISGTVMLFAAVPASIQGLRVARQTILGGQMRVSLHTIGLLILGASNLVVMIVLLIIFSGLAVAWLVSLPMALLFLMAYFARRPADGPKALTALRVPRDRTMTAIRAPLLREPVGFKKAGGLLPMKGHLELYEDAVVLKFAPGIGTARVGIGQGENIPFTHVTSLNGVNIKSWLVKKVQIELQTSLGVTWEISGDQRMFTALQNAYQAWKSKSH